MSMLCGVQEKRLERDINITHMSASVKWLRDCLKTGEHNKISQLLARLPGNNKGIPSLIIYPESTQVI